LILLHNPFCFGLLLGIRLLLYARPDATPSTAYRLVAALQDVLYDLTFFMSSWPLKLTSGFAGHDPNNPRAPDEYRNTTSLLRATTWRANAVIGLMWPGASGQIKPIFIDAFCYSIQARTGCAVCLNGRNRCPEWVSSPLCADTAASDAEAVFIRTRITAIQTGARSVDEFHS
jgi:hypothetical protein